ncbi:hypothetical protein RHMOL_Rhmol08G0162400 [Rhododendron molle]|uniref:Uncharacterized protein n=1 Tax=Rhododendron molle TaxID=49168 RepID=A0ACC0MQ34_RHOML|nr:hypothetical protein RHMOL_Rhmol08G0162400 [Rhododendron molle]
MAGSTLRSTTAQAQVGAAGYLESCSSHTLPLPLVSPPTFTSVIDGSSSGVILGVPATKTASAAASASSLRWKEFELERQVIQEGLLRVYT